MKSSVSPARTACFLPDISYETWDALYTSKLPVLHFGKCTLAVPSISLHFSAGKSTSPFNYQLHAVSWTSGRSPNKDAFMPGKSGGLNGLEYFCFWWKRAVALSHGREDSKKESCSVHGLRYHLRFGMGSPVAWAVQPVSGIWGRTWKFIAYPGFLNLRIPSLPLPVWCSTVL